MNFTMFAFSGMTWDFDVSTYSTDETELNLFGFSERA